MSRLDRVTFNLDKCPQFRKAFQENLQSLRKDSRPFNCSNGIALRFIVLRSQVRGDFAELLEGGFEVFDDFLGQYIEIEKIVGFFEALVPEPEDLQVRLSRKLDLSPFLLSGFS